MVWHRIILSSDSLTGGQDILRCTAAAWRICSTVRRTTEEIARISDPGVVRLHILRRRLPGSGRGQYRYSDPLPDSLEAGRYIDVRFVLLVAIGAHNRLFRITSKVLQRGYRTATIECHITNQKGQLIAAGSHAKALVEVDAKPKAKL